MAISGESAAEEFARLAISLHDAPTVDGTVEKVLEFAVNAVGADHAGVILAHRKGRLETAAATDPIVEKLVASQVDVGEGPVVTVLADRLSVIVSDTRRESRWPAWALLASQAGIRSLLSVRMYTSEAAIGALNLYALRPDAFDGDDQAVAHIFSRHASVALASARKTENLWQAVDARKRVGQAQGILMERFDLTADQAFAVLLRYSQDKNIKLRAVADRVVETRTLPE